MPADCAQYYRWAKPQFQAARYLSGLCVCSRNDRVLDAGCGTGAVSGFLVERFAWLDVTGLDSSSEMLDAYRRVYGKCVEGNLEHMKCVEGNAFDCVVSSFALHWTDVARSLTEIYRIVCKRVYIAVPVEKSLAGMFKGHGNFSFPKTQEFLAILKKLGFRIDHSEVQVLAIPYQGIDLLKHFKYTHARVPALYPYAHVWLRQWVKNSAEEYYDYHVLFVICTKKDA